MSKFVAFIKAGNSDNIITSDKSKLLGSILVIISGLILFLHKYHEYFDASFLMPEKFIRINMPQDAFVSILAIAISPFLLILGNFLKAYFYSYIIPLFCCVFQFYIVLIDYTLLKADNKFVNSFIITFLIFISIYFFRYRSRVKTINEFKSAKNKIKELLGRE